MSVDSHRGGTSVSDRARQPREEETIRFTDESLETLENLIGTAPDFGVSSELHLAGIDDETLHSFEARFQNMLHLADAAVVELVVAIEAVETAGAFADLLGEADVELLKRRQAALLSMKEELNQNRERIVQCLKDRELERTRIEREAQEKERFIRGLNRSGLDAYKLFSTIEKIAPVRAMSFIRQKAEENDPRWNREVAEVEKLYVQEWTRIQGVRQNLEQEFRSHRSKDLLKQADTLDLSPDLKENPNSTKPLVISLRSKGVYAEAVARVRTLYDQEFSDFKVQEEPRLQALEAKALKMREIGIKKALFELNASPEDKVYKMNIEDVTPLLEDGTISRDVVAQNIADEIINKRGGSWKHEALQMTRREVAFLPKDILDLIVAEIDYEGVGVTVRANRETKPAIFWSESFAEKLAEMRKKYENFRGFVFRQTERIDDPESEIAKLFEEYKIQDNALLEVYQNNSGQSEIMEAIGQRNAVFQKELTEVVDRFRIARALRGETGETRIQFGNGRHDFVQVSGDQIYLSETSIFPSDLTTDGVEYRDPRVADLVPSFDHPRMRFDLSPERQVERQRSEFLAVQRMIATMYEQTSRHMQPLPENTEEQEIRAALLAETRKVENAFANLDAELALLKEEAEAFRKKLAEVDLKMMGKELRYLPLEELKALQFEIQTAMTRIFEYNRKVQELRDRAREWGYFGNDSQNYGQGTMIQEERKSWESKIDQSLNFTNAQLRDSTHWGDRSMVRLATGIDQATKNMEANQRLVEAARQQKETSIQNIVFSVEQGFRDLEARISNQEQTMRFNEQLMREAGGLISKIDKVIEENKSVKFGTLWGRKQTISYCSEDGYVSNVYEISETEYEGYKKRMEDLKEKKQKEIEEAKARNQRVMSEIQSHSLEPIYNFAHEQLTDIGLEAVDIAVRLREAARLKDTVNAKIVRILS